MYLFRNDKLSVSVSRMGFLTSYKVLNTNLVKIFYVTWYPVTVSFWDGFAWHGKLANKKI